jgi:hypothetical protein
LIFDWINFVFQLSGIPTPSDLIVIVANDWNVWNVSVTEWLDASLLGSLGTFGRGTIPARGMWS